MTATDIRDTAETTAAVTTMPIADIRIGARHRRRLGKIRKLQASITAEGLLRPIAVTADGLLLAGERRLFACRKLDWTNIPVTVAHDTDHAVALIRDDINAPNNGCTLPMAATELVAVGMLIEELLRPVALARKGLASDGTRRPQSRDIAAEAVGMHTGQYADIRAIVLAARGFEAGPGGSEPLSVGEERQAEARELLDLIDRVCEGENIPWVSPTGRRTRLTIGTISANWRGRHRTGPEAAKPKPTTEISFSESDLGPAPRAHRTGQRKALSSAIGTLTGLCHGLNTIHTIDPAVSADEAASWNRDLAAALRTIRTLQKLAAKPQGAEVSAVAVLPDLHDGQARRKQAQGRHAGCGSAGGCMSPEIRMLPSGKIVGADTLSIADDPRCITLVATLELAVPLWIWELRTCTDKQRAARGNRCAGIVAEQGDILQFGSKQKGKVAGAFNALAEGLACAAYVPGGVTFAGRHWCVDHQACLDAEAVGLAVSDHDPIAMAVPEQRRVEDAAFGAIGREAL